MERFSVSLNEWEESIPLLEVRDEMGVAVLAPTADVDSADLDDPTKYKFMAVGGYSDEGGVLRSTEVFDVGTQAWAAGPPMVLPRYGHGVAVWTPPPVEQMNPNVSAFLPPFFSRAKHVVRRLPSPSVPARLPDRAAAARR